MSDLKRDDVWKREFLLHRQRHLNATQEEEIQKLLSWYDFTSQDARMFKAGWDCCFHCVAESVNIALSGVGTE